MIELLICLACAVFVFWCGMDIGRMQGRSEWKPTQDRYETEMREKLADIDRMVREATNN